MLAGCGTSALQLASLITASVSEVIATCISRPQTKDLPQLYRHAFSVSHNCQPERWGNQSFRRRCSETSVGRSDKDWFKGLAVPFVPRRTLLGTLCTPRKQDSSMFLQTLRGIHKGCCAVQKYHISQLPSIYVMRMMPHKPSSTLIVNSESLSTTCNNLIFGLASNRHDIGVLSIEVICIWLSMPSSCWRFKARHWAAITAWQSLNCSQSLYYTIDYVYFYWMSLNGISKLGHLWQLALCISALLCFDNKR